MAAVYRIAHHDNMDCLSFFLTDTVAGIGVGCLLLGTALGVTFSCIAFRRNSFRKRNRPFKLDEEEDDFRDDEGL